MIALKHQGNKSSVGQASMNMIYEEEKVLMYFNQKKDPQTQALDEYVFTLNLRVVK